MNSYKLCGQRLIRQAVKLGVLRPEILHIQADLNEESIRQEVIEAKKFKRNGRLYVIALVSAAAAIISAAAAWVSLVLNAK